LKNILAIVLLLLMQFGNAQTSDAEKKSIENQINEASRHFSNSEYEQALDLSKQALVRAFKINDEYLISHAYNSIGVIYDEFSETKRAIEFYKKALSHAENIDNDELKNWIYGNLGSAYYFSNIDVKKGIDYYKKSLEYAIKINDSSQIAYTKFNIASAYFSISKFKEGIVWVDEVQDYIDRKGEEEGKFTLNSLLGIYLSNTNRPKEAEEKFFKSIAIAEQNKMSNFLINAYENLSEHYGRFHQKELEKLYKDKFDALSKIVYSDDKKKALEKSAVQIELDEYKIQLERIELENVIHQQKLEESKLVMILFVVICCILLVLIFTLYRSNVFRKKTNKELLKANADMKAAMEKAEEASHLKSQFVSTITHELRTPLYGVVGITNMISDEHKELANSPHLNSLKFSAKYLLSLVNDILQMNKIEEKRVVLEKAPFSIRGEIDTITHSVQYIATNNHNKIVTEIDEDVPKFVMGDKLRLSQIIMNLTSNALKFTRNGTVKISVKQVKAFGDMHYIEFKVIDDGVGIAGSDQDKIFDKFVQVSRKDDDYQGTGLGLAIVKRLIELFGSTIHLKSKLNEGTTFTFTIGFEAHQFNEQDIINNIEVDFTTQEHMSVLVVEDNKINQMVTKKIMDKNNIKCDIVGDGFAALNLLDNEKYDVILMDINMPFINGFETSKRIRSAGIDTPIIALTAFDKEEVKEEANAAGMNDIIIKPFEPLKLFQMMHSVIRKSKNAG
jgi:signal transduction histidine kinase/CheY-like chemotaxis protein